MLQDTCAVEGRRGKGDLARLKRLLANVIAEADDVASESRYQNVNNTDSRLRATQKIGRLSHPMSDFAGESRRLESAEEREEMLSSIAHQARDSFEDHDTVVLTTPDLRLSPPAAPTDTTEK